MSIRANHVGDDLTIKIQGKFDFSAHQEFRAAYENMSEKPGRFIIDMSETTYLDSSALGMLLLLRDFAGGESADIKVSNCNPEIKKILAISNFEQLFEIS